MNAYIRYGKSHNHHLPRLCLFFLLAYFTRPHTAQADHPSPKAPVLTGRLDFHSGLSGSDGGGGSGGICR
jgi:hypothetical protein